MLRILSWDCAYKTLGWAVIAVDTNVLVNNLIHRAKVASARESPHAYHQALCDQKNMLEAWLQIEEIGVDNVLRGKKLKDVSSIDRAKYLHDYLVTAPNATARYDMILIESQPAQLVRGFTKKVNTGSTVVAQQLLLHYHDQNCRMISPRKKNGATLTPELNFDTWSKGVNSYEMRKKHTVACLEFLQVFMTNKAREQMTVIPRKILNNAADAVMQVVAILPDIVIKPSHRK